MINPVNVRTHLLMVLKVLLVICSLKNMFITWDFHIWKVGIFFLIFEGSESVALVLKDHLLKVKGKGWYGSSWVEPHLRATGCHLPCGITQCHLPYT